MGTKENDMSVDCRFGANYTPSKDWLYGWIDWDAASIRRDLEAIAGLGLDHIRLQCLWTYFQPNRTFVSPTMLKRLADVVEMAADCGLDVVICVLNGWMSGTFFRPLWQRESTNLFTDAEALDAERRLITAVAGAVEGHRNVLGIDIGNEPNALASYRGNDVTRSEGDAWATMLLEHSERAMPGGLHTIGVDHMPWLRDDAPFSREPLGEAGAVTSLHSWLDFTGALERYGTDGTGTLHLARYLIELGRAYGRPSGRPVWLQEIGVSTEWVPEDALPEFAATLLRNALIAKPWGVTWWCSHDIDRSLTGFDELEYDLGLLTVDNQVKPVGAALAEVIAAHRGGATSDTRDATRPRPELVLPEGEVPDLAFADGYFELIARGEDPVIVREGIAVGRPDLTESRPI